MRTRSVPSSIRESDTEPQTWPQMISEESKDCDDTGADTDLPGDSGSLDYPSDTADADDTDRSSPSPSPEPDSVLTTSIGAFRFGSPLPPPLRPIAGRSPSKSGCPAAKEPSPFKFGFVPAYHQVPFDFAHPAPIGFSATIPASASSKQLNTDVQPPVDPFDLTVPTQRRQFTATLGILGPYRKHGRPNRLHRSPEHDHMEQSCAPSLNREAFQALVQPKAGVANEPTSATNPFPTWCSPIPVPAAFSSWATRPAPVPNTSSSAPALGTLDSPIPILSPGSELTERVSANGPTAPSTLCCDNDSKRKQESLRLLSDLAHLVSEILYAVLRSWC